MPHPARLTSSLLDLALRRRLRVPELRPDGRVPAAADFAAFMQVANGALRALQTGGAPAALQGSETQH